jgi:hypothetical protein
MKYGWSWLIFLSVLQPLIAGSGEEVISASDERREQARNIMTGDTQDRLVKAYALPVLCGAGVIGLCVAARCVHKKNNASKNLTNTKVYYKRRALARWLTLCGCICLLAGVGATIPAVQLSCDMAWATRVLQAPLSQEEKTE